MQHTYQIVVGDWSGDGHEKSDKFTFECTHDEDAIIAGYKKACKKAQVQLHGDGPNSVLSDYEDSKLSEDALEKLDKLGIDFDQLEGDKDEGELYCTPKDCAVLFLEMAQSQIDGFKYSIVEDKVKCINGFWNKKFNESIGYGCF